MYCAPCSSVTSALIAQALVPAEYATQIHTPGVNAYVCLPYLGSCQLACKSGLIGAVQQLITLQRCHVPKQLSNATINICKFCQYFTLELAWSSTHSADKTKQHTRPLHVITRNWLWRGFQNIFLDFLIHNHLHHCKATDICGTLAASIGRT